MKKPLLLLLCFLSIMMISQWAGGQLPTGTYRQTLEADTNGNVLNTNLVFSNQCKFVPAPSDAQHAVRWQDMTNNTVTNNTAINASIASAAGAGSNYANGLCQGTTGFVNSVAAILASNNTFLRTNWFVTAVATNAGIVVGTNDTTKAKLYITGEAGQYTNKPLVKLNRTSAGTSNILEWCTNGICIGAIDTVGNLTTFGNLTCYGTLTATNTSIKRPHIMLSNTNTLTNAGVTLSNVVPWSVIEDAYLITTNGTKVVMPQVGSYFVAISAIFRGGVNEGSNANVWVSQNGTNVARSGTQVSFPTVSGGGTVTNLSMVVAVPFILHISSPNEYFEVLWWSDNSAVVMPTTPAGTGPPRPMSPSIIMTVEKASGGAD